MYEQIKSQAETAARELVAASGIKAGEIFVVGCSSSEIVGKNIGKGSDLDAAAAVFEGVYPVIKEHGLYLAAQCCEHLNRAVVIETECAERFGYEEVNVVPQQKAGGGFATTCYRNFDAPCVVEGVRARAGMDIGGTLIGMQLRRVAVPVRLSLRQIGQATLICARTRPAFIGGSRAVYDESKM